MLFRTPTTPEPRRRAQPPRPRLRVFHEDPTARWVIADDERRRRASPAMYRTTLHHVALTVGRTDVGEAGARPVSVALWIPPGRRADPPGMLRKLRALARMAGGTAPRWSGHRLAELDRLGLPAYLETANERTVRLYERLGFSVRERVDLPGGGPTMWTMLRPPCLTPGR